MKSILLSILVAPLIAGAALAGDWMQFRGPNASAVSTDDAAPGAMLTEAWSADLPGRGLSSPIIIGDKVVLTCSSGPDQSDLHVLCFSAADGSKLWERKLRATGRTMSHKKTCVAAPTPCSDGELVYALYSSNDLFAFDLEGNLQWLRGLTFDYPNASNSLGMASSPVVVGKTLVVQSENDSESIALGNWTSGVIWNDVVALQSRTGLTGVDPLSGKVLWDYQDGAATITSSAVTRDAIYVPSNGITAILPEESSTSQLWRAEKLKPGTPSPLVLGDAIYVVNGAGVLVKASLDGGEEQWKLRLKGPFSGSAVAAGTYLYIANERGQFQVVDTTATEGEVVQTLELDDTLDDTILATPAISGNAVYIRSDAKLWKLAGK
jgi:outer membrane protein assembly factor BamB